MSYETESHDEHPKIGLDHVTTGDQPERYSGPNVNHDGAHLTVQVDVERDEPYDQDY